MVSTRGEGLNVQPDTSCYLRLGHRLFRVCSPEEKSGDSRKMILFQHWNMKTEDVVGDKHLKTRGADGNFSLISSCLCSVPEASDDEDQSGVV